MPTTSFSRTAVATGFTLLGLVLALGLLQSYARERLESAQMDWWSLPRIFAEQQRSEKAVVCAQRIRDDLHQVAQLRAALLQRVMDREVTVTQGLEELREVYETSPGLQLTLSGIYQGMEKEAALQKYYSDMLRDFVREDLQELAWLDLALEELTTGTSGAEIMLSMR